MQLAACRQEGVLYPQLNDCAGHETHALHKAGACPSQVLASEALHAGTLRIAQDVPESQPDTFSALSDRLPLAHTKSPHLNFSVAPCTSE